jgi:hypothetical protein
VAFTAGEPGSWITITWSASALLGAAVAAVAATTQSAHQQRTRSIPSRS